MHLASTNAHFYLGSNFYEKPVFWDQWYSSNIDFIEHLISSFHRKQYFHLFHYLQTLDFYLLAPSFSKIALLTIFSLFIMMDILSLN